MLAIPDGFSLFEIQEFLKFVSNTIDSCVLTGMDSGQNNPGQNDLRPKQPVTNKMGAVRLDISIGSSH